MKRSFQLPVGAVLATFVLTSCGGSNEPDSRPETAPTRSAEPSASASTVGPQPVGKFGFQTKILNWDSYAGDPSVRDLTKAWEAISASVNRKRFVPDYSTRLTAAGQRQFATNLKPAWDNNWRVAKVAEFRIVDVVEEQSRREIEACMWAPSTSYMRPDNSFVDAAPEWDRVEFTLRRSGSTWVLHRLSTTGKCQGEAPA